MSRTKDGRFAEKRILIEKRSLKKLIYTIKEKYHFTWDEFASRLRVSSQSIKHDWMDEKSTVPQSIFQKLVAMSGKDKKSYKFKIIEPFWGQKYAYGKLKLKDVKTPDQTDPQFSEFYGILLGDGCVFSDLKGLSISGDRFLDYPYYHQYLKELIFKLFSTYPSLYFVKNERTIKCIVYSKVITNFLVGCDFPSGIKYKKNPIIPNFIFKNKENLALCIRGLMDTDGSISAHPHSKIMIHLSITIKSLRNSVHKGLEELGIISGIFDKGIMIYGEDKINKFYKIIGFSNFKNLYKYNEFLLTGKVPSSKQVETFIRTKEGV